MALVAHLMGIVPPGILVILFLWLTSKDDPAKAFAADQAKEALNFAITATIAAILSGVLIFLVIGLLLLPAVMIANLVLCILAAIKVGKGETYRFPFALRPIR